MMEPYTHNATATGFPFGRRITLAVALPMFTYSLASPHREWALAKTFWLLMGFAFVKQFQTTRIFFSARTHIVNFLD